MIVFEMKSTLEQLTLERTTEKNKRFVRRRECSEEIDGFRTGDGKFLLESQPGSLFFRARRAPIFGDVQIADRSPRFSRDNVLQSYPSSFFDIGNVCRGPRGSQWFSWSTMNCARILPPGPTKAKGLRCAWGCCDPSTGV